MATGVAMVIYHGKARCKEEKERSSEGRRKKRNSPRIDGRIRGVCSTFLSLMVEEKCAQEEI